MQNIIVLTRPEAKNHDLAFSLSAAIEQEKLLHNTQVINLPALKIRPYTWEELSLDAQKDFQHLMSFDAVFCVSPTAIQIFFRLLSQYQIELPSQLYFLCVGTGSRDELLHFGIDHAHIIMAEQGNDSEALLATLKQEANSVFQKVLIVRAQTGREWFKEQLKAQGIDIRVHAIYSREPALLSPEQESFFKSLPLESSVQYLWTSSESVQGLLPRLCQLGIFDDMLSIAHHSSKKGIQHKFWVIHSRIGETIKAVFADYFSVSLKDLSLDISLIEAENMQIQATVLKYIHNIS